MKKRNFLLLLLFFVLPVSAQDTITLMSYNLLNYPGTNSSARNVHFKVTLGAVQPDILVVQEVTSQIGIDAMYYNVLKTISDKYYKGAFKDGPDSDNGIFYDSTKFGFLDNTPIRTELRDINLFRLRHRVTEDTLNIFSVHLKASTGATNEAQRGREVDSLRKYTNSLPPGTNFLVCGDFNIYSSTEVAYQKLRAAAPGTEGHFIDPLVMTGSFGQSQYAVHHTQSTRTRAFEGGSTGGLDDRFDMILFSKAIVDFGGVEFVRNSYRAYGNDGSHYKDSVNRPPNNAVGQDIANALHYSSDHLPVIVQLIFKENVVGINEPELPDDFQVENAYPNPFNPATTIGWNLPYAGEVNLYVYNALGQLVSTNFFGETPPGAGSYIFDASGLSSGVYFARLEYLHGKEISNRIIKLNLMK
ncbi:MAG: T9SS type A sorting domain-containing protein [Ignavibacteriales bacterium]|nr:MAG: T9SS type A sorting domain-containing protein [Ignavibacteriaceae bacterium]MBW7871838.1 T9SS type A sorting domain-containing protein [Ignavibacteria bacterium]MCZ2144312.1 T9SS type A sorting domain-containing protein [Ignavibacteriales bacterium]MBV6446265.1 hypothetical protein [Ignavibacteriaceae bacterium]MBZ0195795.1 T9SS type A sorting domain-containing protein [Ignavibacteriaceae bacterium]